MAKKNKAEKDYSRPLLLTAAEMSRVCGIGEHTLRRLMAENKLEYLQVGSHKLLCEAAIWAYYERNKTVAKSDQLAGA